MESKSHLSSGESSPSSGPGFQVIQAKLDNKSVLGLSEAIHNTQIREGRRVWTSLLVIPLLIPTFMAAKYAIDPQYRSQVHQVFTVENLQRLLGIKFKQEHQPSEHIQENGQDVTVVENLVVATEYKEQTGLPTRVPLDEMALETAQPENGTSGDGVSAQVPLSLSTELNPATDPVANYHDEKSQTEEFIAFNIGDEINDSTDKIIMVDSETPIAQTLVVDDANTSATSIQDPPQQDVTQNVELSDESIAVEAKLVPHQGATTGMASNPEPAQTRPLISDDISEAVAEVEAHEAKAVSNFWKQPIAYLNSSDDSDDKTPQSFTPEREREQSHESTTRPSQLPQTSSGYSRQRPTVRRQYMVPSDPDKHFQARLRKLEKNPPSATENSEEYHRWKSEIEALRKILGL